MSWSEFDDYCERNNVPMEETHLAFGQWLAELTGGAIIGGPVGEVPEAVFLPEDES